jgi:hypothetical protein
MDPVPSNAQEEVLPSLDSDDDPTWGDTVVRRLWDHAARGAALPAPATEPAEPVPADPADPSVATEETPRMAELEQQVRDVESLRTSEVGDLQQAQADLANTQVVLVQTTKKLREAEDRLRQLERIVLDAGLTVDEPSEPERPPARDRASIATSAAPEPKHDEMWSDPAPAEPAANASLMDRLASLRAELVPDPEPTASWSAPDADEAPDAGFSLRDRLTRAAAARHRTST